MSYINLNSLLLKPGKVWLYHFVALQLTCNYWAIAHTDKSGKKRWLCESVMRPKEMTSVSKGNWRIEQKEQWKWDFIYLCFLIGTLLELTIEWPNWKCLKKPNLKVFFVCVCGGGGRECQTNSVSYCDRMTKKLFKYQTGTSLSFSVSHVTVPSTE